MRLAPGDKVRITQSAFENDLVDNTLVATEGSLGAVLSYETYCDYIHNSCSADFAREHLPLVKKCINEGTQYPVRFEMVVPRRKSCASIGGREGASL